MNLTLVLLQLLNGLQYGVLLFLLAAGLTLIFGIMSVVNLAHGSLYMLGAYFAAMGYHHSGSFLIGVLAALGGCVVVGIVLERIAISRLYSREHLDHVLVTFGMVLFFNEMALILWGTQPYFFPIPSFLQGAVQILGATYPVYRLSIILVGLVAVFGAHWLIHKTRLGMLIRAGSVNANLVSALGVNIKFLNALLFAIGSALAGLAGLMAGPILAVQSGMGDQVLITTLVVIVIGGIGSVSGAFYAAVLVGLVDTMGRAFLPLLLRELMARDLANAAGPAIASMLIYILMAIVLTIRPQGLFFYGAKKS